MLKRKLFFLVALFFQNFLVEKNSSMLSKGGVPVEGLHDSLKAVEKNSPQIEAVAQGVLTKDLDRVAKGLVPLADKLPDQYKRAARLGLQAAPGVVKAVSPALSEAANESQRLAELEAALKETGIFEGSVELDLGDSPRSGVAAGSPQDLSLEDLSSLTRVEQALEEEAASLRKNEAKWPPVTFVDPGMSVADQGGPGQIRVKFLRHHDPLPSKEAAFGSPKSLDYSSGNDSDAPLLQGSQDLHGKSRKNVDPAASNGAGRRRRGPRK